MILSPDAHRALIDEVEHQAGAMLPDPCIPGDITFGKEYIQAHQGTLKGVTCGCKNDNVRFVNVYETDDSDEGKAQRKRGGGFVTACAVCDNMAHWPRFIDAVIDSDPDMDPCWEDPGDDEEPNG
jgi:hypothetical protein